MPRVLRTKSTGELLENIPKRVIHVLKQLARDKWRLRQAQAIFLELDEDGNKSLDAVEVKRGLERLGVDCTDECVYDLVRSRTFVRTVPVQPALPRTRLGRLPSNAPVV